jgi:hypothetical protein
MMKPDRAHRLTAAITAAAMLLTAISPAVGLAGTPAEDLKQIEYQYYFRGKYVQAIDALRTYLARVDLAPANAVRAREFLAASHVLSGDAASGKDVFAGLMAADPAYAGPDPAVFKAEVMDVFGLARSEYAAQAIKTAPRVVVDEQPEPVASARDDDSGKPIYKQWWLYAGVAALAIAVGAAAGGGGGDDTAGPRGTIVVGVEVK